MPCIPFVKATACGNDFLIIDFAHAPSDIHAFTRRICDRHNGVGADGVEWVLPATDADLARAAVECRWLRGRDLGQWNALRRGVVLRRESPRARW